MSTELTRRLSDMAERGVWRGADAAMASARAALAPTGGVLAPERAAGWRLPGPALAAMIALVFLVVFGGVVLLLNWPQGGPVVSNTVPVTTTIAPTTTAVTPTTLAPTTTVAPSTTTTPPSTTTTVPAFPEALRMTWTRVPPQEALEGGWMAAATQGGPGIVAVGGSAVGADAAVWLSGDGTAWERIASEAFHGVPDQVGSEGDQYMSDVVVGPQGLVAVGADGKVGGRYRAAVWLSPDGRSWERVAHDEAVFGEGQNTTMNAVVVGGTGLVAVGQVGGRAAAWASADGVAWTRVFDGEENSAMKDAVAWNGRLYAVGYAGLQRFMSGTGWETVEPYRPVVWASDDGLTWQRLPEASSPGAAGVDLGPSWPDKEWELWRVVVDQTGLIALATPPADYSSGTVAQPGAWRSADGATWAKTEGIFVGLERSGWFPTSLLAHEGRLLIGHGEGTIWGSVDGGAYWHRITGFELGSGVAAGGQDLRTSAWFWSVDDLLGLGPSVLAVGSDSVYSGTEEIGGSCLAVTSGQCRTDAAVWIGTWDQG